MRRLLLLLLLLAQGLRAEQVDVLIYGATPAGIAAAISAAKDGDRVLLVEPSGGIGGMLTNGLSHGDFRTFESLSGTYLDFTHRVEKSYRDAHGADSPQVRDCFHGANGEPKVNLTVLQQMMAEQPRIHVQTHWALEGVQCSSAGEDEDAATRRMRALEIALFFDETTGDYHSIAAPYFVDATYEGDLMAAAGVAYRVGREGKEDYGEPAAPATPDAQIEAYTFHFAVTRDPEKRIIPEAPFGYNPDDFRPLVPLLERGEIEQVFGTDGNMIYRLQTPPGPNGRFEVTDKPGSPIRLAMAGENDAWPDGGAGAAIREGNDESIDAPPFSRVGLARSRERIFATQLAWSAGLLYFVQHDDSVPQKLREEAAAWGWCKDEFANSGYLPARMEIREARRMVGRYVFTQQDTEPAAEGEAKTERDVRAVNHPDAIAIGDFGVTCFGTAHEDPAFGGKQLGELHKLTVPYQIPYGTIVPRTVENLLVPVAVSASHVGHCSLHYEPVWMALGQAAGHAAHLARLERHPVQQISVSHLQAMLHEDGAATCYVSDIPPGSLDFSTVQWWATAGGFHEIANRTEPGAHLGKNITGPYFEAFPGHAAELDLALTPEIQSHWIKTATDLHLDKSMLPPADGKVTRRNWLKAAYRTHSPQ